MSIADKQLFLRQLCDKLGDFIPANDVNQILAAADETLRGYEMERLPPDENDDSMELLQYYLDAKRVEGKSPETIKHYRYMMTRVWKDTGVPFRYLTNNKIREYFEDKEKRGKSWRTVEDYRQNIMAFFRWMKREGLLDNDPLSNLTVIKKQKTIKKPFTSVELMKINEAAESTRDKALISFLRSTGCRVSEVCSVNREDIDYQRLQLTVFGKGAKERVVFIDEVTAVLLQRYLDERTDSSPALFAGKGTDRLTPSGVETMLRRISKISGVKKVHPHRFRRTLATSLINSGMPIHEVAVILGHEKIDTTMTYIYTDVQNVASSYKKFAACR